MNPSIKNSTIYFVNDKDYLYHNYKRIEKPKFSYENTRYSYYQSEIHKLSCSLHATMTVISNNMNYRFSLEERKEILKLAISRGFDVNIGWYMDKAVKCVVDYCNENLGMDLVYIRVPYDKFEELADRGFGIVSGYRQLSGMGKDRDDGTIGENKSEIEKYGNSQFGHLVSFWMFKKRVNQKDFWNGEEIGDRQFGFVDNYFPYHKNNETFIKNLDDLVDKGSLFPTGYIIVDRKNTKPRTLEMLKQRIRDFRKILNYSVTKK